MLPVIANLFRQSSLSANTLRCSRVSLTRNISAISSETEQEHSGAELDKLYKVVELELRGNDPAVLKSYQTFSQAAAGHLNVNVLRSWTPKKAHHERYTLLRSIHVNKKCRTQYEFRTYYSFIQFEKLTSSTCDTLLEYLQRNLPEGVAMKATTVELEKIPSHIQPTDNSPQPKALQ